MNVQKTLVAVSKGLVILLVVMLVGGSVYVYGQKNDINFFGKKSFKTQIMPSVENSTSTPELNSLNSLENLNLLKDEANASAGKEIISKIGTSTDSYGKIYNTITINPKNVVEEGFEKRDKNLYARSLLNTEITSMFVGFETKAMEYKNNTGSYVGVCDDSKKILSGMAGVSRQDDDEMLIEIYKQSGITIDSYRITESVCKSNESSFVITMPIPFKDGTDGLICLTNRVGIANPIFKGKADFDSMTCVGERF